MIKKHGLFFLLLFQFLWVGCSSNDEPVIEPEQETETPFQLPKKAYVLAEQAKHAIIIRNAETHEIVWNWNYSLAPIPVAHQPWFINPSEVKPVFNKRYILMTASGGAVALIRLADKKLMFYAYCGQNPHSAEILPDGNIVTAESKQGEINTFVVDTANLLGTKSHTVKLGNAHNVVWDRKRSCLYASGTISAGVAALFRFEYNGNRANPQLMNQQRIYTFDEESGGHDLFPVFGEENKLWFTAASAVYQFDLSNDPVTCQKIYDMPNIKSISNGPEGIIMLQPTEQWWAEGLINENGKELFKMNSAKIYKGRWMLDNTFSYPKQHDFHTPNNSY